MIVGVHHCVSNDVGKRFGGENQLMRYMSTLMRNDDVVTFPCLQMCLFFFFISNSLFALASEFLSKMSMILIF